MCELYKTYEVFDFETRITSTGILIPVCCVFSINGNFFSIYQNSVQEEGSSILDEFFKICKNKIHNHQVMYIHNLDFDGLLILHYVLKNKIPYNWFYTNSKLYNLKVYINNVTLEFRCSYKILPYSLNYLGEKYLNIQKTIFPYKILYSDESLLDKIVNLDLNSFNNIFEYTNFKKTQNLVNFNIIDNLVSYCVQDANILRKLINLYWITLNDLNIKDTGFMYSASSITLQYYIKNYNLIDLNPKEIFDNYAREGYYNGRDEVFGNLVENEIALQYKYPNIYALCLLENLPASDYYFCNPTNIELPGFYKITFCSNLDYPILPVKTDKLYFPNGTYTGTYWFEEILLFLKYGGIIKEIHSALISKEYLAVTKEFSEKLMVLKEKSDWFSLAVELVINSFYGRLGIKSGGSIASVTNNAFIAETTQNYTQFEGYYIYEKNYKSTIKSNVLVAAAITSKVRIQLYEILQYIIKNGGRPLCCNTDSIIWAINKNLNLSWERCFKIHNANIDFNKKIVENFIKKAIFVDTKTYAIVLANNEETIKINGILNQTLKFDDFLEAWKKNKTLNFIDQINYTTRNYQGCWLKINKEINLIMSNKRNFNYNNTESKALNNLVVT